MSALSSCGCRVSVSVYCSVLERNGERGNGIGIGALSGTVGRVDQEHFADGSCKASEKHQNTIGN
jgi:hypothetical protein